MSQGIHAYLTPEQIAEGRALLEKASPAPWEAWDKRGRPLYDRPISLGGKVVGHTGPSDHGVLIPYPWGSKLNHSMPTVEDDALVAWLRNHAEALLSAATDSCEV